MCSNCARQWYNKHGQQKPQKSRRTKTFIALGKNKQHQKDTVMSVVEMKFWQSINIRVNAQLAM